MKYDPSKHDRQSIRLKGHDYSSPGEYFLNSCTKNRECRFGKVVNSEMILNIAGKMIDKWWKKIPEKFPNAVLDVYQIMPNHFHAIVGITVPTKNVRVDLPKNVGVDPGVDPEGDDNQVQGDHVGSPQPGARQPGLDFKSRPASVDAIVQWFKTMTTNEYIRGVKKGIFPPFDRKLWQRNYYEHIIRNDKSLQRIRDYIINNPAKWEQDRNHPDNW